MPRGGWREEARGKVGRPSRQITVTLDALTLKALRAEALSSGLTSEELAARILMAHVEAQALAQEPAQDWQGEVL
jgi:hypothetical protein